MNHLNRAQAPFPARVWETIDEAAVRAATPLLTGRRFLEVEGPYGLGLTALEVSADDYCRTPEKGEAVAILRRALSVPMLRKSCRLSVRRLAVHLEKGMPLSLTEVLDAAEAVARREEEFLYHGEPEVGLQGLLNARGHQEIRGADWADLDNALNNVLAAISKLDEPAAVCVLTD